MKKFFTLISALAMIVLIGMGKEYLIQLQMKNGEEHSFPVTSVDEIRFIAMDDALPEDPYPSATDFSQKALLLQHTGTKCVHCPMMVMGLRNLAGDAAYSSRFTLAALHSYSGDPMSNATVRAISDAYRGNNGWPYTTADFKKNGVGNNSSINIITDNLKNLVDNELSASVPSGIASISQLNNRTLNLTLAMKAGVDGDYRVGAFVIEDGVKAEQDNAHTDVTGDADFSTHNNVLRAAVGPDAEGTYTGIDLGSVKKGKTAYTTQELELGTGWKAENCRLLIYVAQKVDGQWICVNSAYAPLDGETSFEYDQSAPATDSYVKLGNSMVSAEAAGGQQSVSITLASGATADQIKLSASETWIKSLNVTNSEITFTLDENTSEETRKGRVTVTYGNARPIDISVVQKGKANGSDDLFIINSTILTPYQASVTFTPNGYEGNYLFLVVKAETLDKYIDAGNIDGWIEGDLEWLRSSAASYDLTLEEFLPMYKEAYMTDGFPVTMTYSSLSPDTEYYAYCYGLTTKGERTTDFYKAKFKTTVVNQVDLDLTATVSDITESGAKVVVTPSDNEVTYFWTYVSEMDMAQYDLNFIMDNMIKNVMTAVAQGADINTIIHKGTSSENIQNLWKGTKYHLIGWGMDTRGNATTAPKQFGEFSTLSQSVGSDCTFEIECPTVKDSDILIHITPSDNSIRYYVACVDETKCTGYNDEQMAQRLINMEAARFDQGFYGAGKNWGNVDWMLSGEQTKWGRDDLLWTFSPNHTYNIYVFGIDANGVRNTPVAKKVQTTIGAGQVDMTVDIKLDNATWDYGTFTFTPTNNDEYYIPFLVETRELEYVTNPDGTLDEQAIIDEMVHYYDDSPNYYTLKGEGQRRFRWQSDKDYTMLVCGWSGGNTTPFFRLDTHTPAIPFNESDADVECTYELFDADALAEIDYNRWKEYAGCVVIRLQFNPNEHAETWCGGVWMPEYVYEDSGGKDHLLTLIQNPDVSIVNRRTAMYRTLNYNTEYSLSYIAMDKDGKYGPWHYVEFTPKEGENITEAYDFWTRKDAPDYVIAVAPDGTTKPVNFASFSKNAVKAKADGRATASVKAQNTDKADSLGRN